MRHINAGAPSSAFVYFQLYVALRSLLFLRLPFNYFL